MALKQDVNDIALKGADPRDVLRMLDSGEITEDEANDFASYESFRTKGFYGMDPQSAVHLYERGHINEEQMEDYLDANESPVWFGIKDVAYRSVPHGVNEAVRNVWNFFRDFTGADTVMKLASEGGKKTAATDLLKPMPNIMPEPKTLAGDIGSGITEFVVPFVPSMKAVKGSALGADALMKTEWFTKLAAKAPNLAKGAAVAVEGAAAGAAVDFVDDPFGGRLADLAKEHGYLPDYLEWMATDKNNPAATERFKNVLEGMGLGVFVDGLLTLAKATKAKYWGKAHDDADLVAENIRKDFPDTDPATLDGTAHVEVKAKTPEETIAKATAAEGVDHRAVYEKLKVASGGSHVDIAPLRDALGLTQDQMAGVLRRAQKEGTAVLALGEPAVVGDYLKEGAVDGNLLVKLDDKFFEMFEQREAAALGVKKSEPVVVRKPTRKIVQPQANRAPAVDAALPPSLSKSTPRYKDADIDFESDIDKALYIVSGKGKSKSHEAYRTWLRETVGMTDDQIDAAGKDLREFLKGEPNEGLFYVPNRRKAAQSATMEAAEEAPQAAPKAATVPEPSPEDIAKAEPWQLTKEQYAKKIESDKLPTGKELFDNPAKLEIEGMSKEDLKALTDDLGLDGEGGKKKLGSSVRSILMAEHFLETVGAKGFAKMPEKERLELIHKIMGGADKVGRGMGATPEKVFGKLMARIQEAKPIIQKHVGKAKHAAEVRRAIGQGMDVPGYVLEQYKHTDWVQEYAKKRGLTLGKEAVAETPPGKIVEPEASPKAPEAPKAPESPQSPAPKPAEGAEIPTSGPKAADSADRTVQAIKIFKAQTDDKIRSIDDLIIDDSQFLQRIETGSNHGTVALLNDIYRESSEMIEKVRARGSGSFANIERQAGGIWKRLGDLTGKHANFAVDHFMGAARGIYSEMKHKAAQAHFVNEFLTTYTSKVDELVDQAIRTQDRVLELQAITHIKQLQELTELVFGIRAGAGRLLNSYNMKFMKGKFDFANLPTNALDDITARRGEQMKEALKAFKAAKDPKAKMRVARSVGRNKLMRGVLELVQANLLWNPTTHAVNIASNSVNLALHLVNRSMALSMQAALHADTAPLKAALAGWTGLLDGFMAATKFEGLIDAVRGKASFRDIKPGNMWKSFWRAESTIDVVLKEPGMEDSILKEALAGTGWGKSMATLVTLPFNALAGADELFKNLAYFSRVKELAVSASLEKGLKGKDLKLSVKSMLSDVPTNLHYQAEKYMRDVTFQGNVAPKIQNALSGGWGTMFRIAFMPFFKTPANILKQAFGYTPLAALQGDFRKAIMNHGSIEQKEAISRLIMGSAGMFAVSQMYDAGLITGRKPKDQANQWDANGIQEYSVWNGKSWVAYDRMDPAGMVLGLFADTFYLFDLIDAMDDDKIKGEDVWAAAALTLFEATINKTWMTSVRDAVQIVSDPDRMNWGRLAATQSEKFLTASSGFKWWQERQDQYVRQYKEAIDGYIGYYDRTELSVKRHIVYGSKVEREDKSLGLFRQKTPTEDPVLREMLDVHAEVRPMDANVTVGTIKRELNPREIQQVNDILETLDVQGQLAQAIADPRYQAVQDADTRADILKKIVSDSRQAAKDIFVAGREDIVEDAKAKLKVKAEAILGYHSAPDPRTRILKWNVWSTIK